MNNSLIKFLSFVFISTALLFTACEEEDIIVEIDPVEEKGTVTVRNTFQSELFGFPDEIPFGDTVTADVSHSNIEFAGYLGFYQIDFTSNSLSFELLDEAADNPDIAALFRVIEPGTFDRYYFTFSEAQNIGSVTVNNASVSVKINSDKELVVEIGEGYDFSPGNAVFTVDFEN